jgi:hypothetical protein
MDKRRYAYRSSAFRLFETGYPGWICSAVWAQSGWVLVIIEAESEAAARDFMENDPFVVGGLMRASLHPFRASLIRT